MIEQNLILILVLLPFLGAIAAATLPVNAHGAAAWVSGLSLAAGLVILLTLWPQISEDEVVRSLGQSGSWARVQREDGQKGWVARRLTWGW